ncbi:putative efflux pump membrane transporter TtgB [Gemmata obscuriglobus]|uniref:AcrB/AcrD/AcrF family protein n=1 Tax=Gemmata obscuriglobus TaxID=114 RepID=A0A2Z3GV95_9BACT|nr:efflux RND transporter permease subunit [Gemmata obscuriglobus]AWM38319.1 AcrB/AcrD/AcrF family protein [Gemmata obscuriglobus]QEG28766.1 putative efflux pump membrane transporter TtgB [Gemmata obscuriglobus]VTS07096.1 rnd transporter : Acriflavin resistance protein OS=Gloeobacter kilaueensis JS1 GN=GKIL_3115 PE=4 SV=1: ACR_tran [Gemmata obscuriglobus UQM 2246]
MWIVKLALDRTYTFVVVSLLILVVGIVAIYKMPQDNFPDIDIPVVTVVYLYSGMPADDIEKRILLVTERVLTASVNDIEHMESQAYTGTGVIRIYFRPNAKIEAATAQVTATCQTVLSNMPQGTTPPYIVRYSATSVPVAQIAVSSDTLTEAELYDYAANFIIQRLGTVQGARVPQPYGGKPRQIMVDLDPQQLYARGLSAADVSTAVNAQNLILPAGTAKIGETDFNIKVNSSPELVEAFNQMPVKTVNGTPVYLRDVAQVRDGYAVQTNVVRRDGKRAVLLPIMKGEGASTIEVVSRVRQALPGIQAQLPPELKLEVLFDQSVFVRESVNGVLHEGAVAAGLTALLILVFLGSWRSTLIIIISIPLSVMCSILCLWAFGETLNVMTLGGMALAVGILVDDATVEIENVHRNMAMRKPLRHAILDGAQQIAIPALVSTLAICIVFVPVVFLTGPAAYLFIPLAMAVIFAMLASYFLSRTLVPTLMLFLLGREARQYASGQHDAPSGVFGKLHAKFESTFERVRQAYRGLLDWALHNRGVTVALMLGFAIGSFALVPFIGRDFFPTVDAGQIRLHVRAPAGTRLEETERIFGQIEDVIREQIPDAERDTVIDNMGVSPFYTNTAYINNELVSVYDGEILVSLKHEHRPTADHIRKLRQELPKRFPGCTFDFLPADVTGQVLTFGKPAPVNVQVVGVRREENLAVAKQLREKLSKIPGVVDVRLRQIADAPEIRVDVDRVMASGLNVTQQEAARSLLVSLSSSFQGTPNFWVNPKNGVNYRVAVQTPQTRIDSVDALLSTPVTGEGTEPQLLSNLATVRRAESSGLISHYNVQTVYEVCATVQDRDLGGAAADIKAVVEEARGTLPKGSTLAIRGQIESMDESFAGLGFGLLFAVLLVYLLMVVNFQSWTDPFVILMALPGAAAGILWALFATGTTVSVPALMGGIMTVGVATANSILMVTFANEKRAAGLNGRRAALAAGSTRLRPVLMTAMAMIAGMLPMSLGHGEGGEQNAPLGRAVIGGLTVATAYTLFFVPVMYSLLRPKPAPAEPADAN